MDLVTYNEYKKMNLSNEWKPFRKDQKLRVILDCYMHLDEDELDLFYEFVTKHNMEQDWDDKLQFTIEFTRYSKESSEFKNVFYDFIYGNKAHVIRYYSDEVPPIPKLSYVEMYSGNKHFFSLYAHRRAEVSDKDNMKIIDELLKGDYKHYVSEKQYAYIEELLHLDPIIKEPVSTM